MINIRRILKWSTGILFLLCVTISLLLLVLYYSLRAGELTQQALPKLEPYLAPLGIEISQLNNAKIDLLKSVNINDLALRWQDEQQGFVELRLAEADIAYDLWGLFDEQFTLSRLRLNNLHIKAELDLAETSEETAEPVTDPLQALTDVLNSPPLALLIAENIEISQISLDLSLRQGPQHIVYRGAIQGLKANVRWEPSDLNGMLSLALGQTHNEQLIITETQGDKVISRIQLQPQLSAEADWQFKQTDGQWHISNSLHSDLQLRGLTIEQQVDTQTDQINAEQLHLSFKQTSQGLLDEDINYEIAINNTPARVEVLQANSAVPTSAIDLKLTPQILLTSRGTLRQKGTQDWQINNTLDTALTLQDVRYQEHLDKTHTQASSSNVHLSINSQQQGATDQGFNFNIDLNTNMARLELKESLEKTHSSLLQLTPQFQLSGSGKAVADQNQWQFDTRFTASSQLKHINLKQEQGAERLSLKTEHLQLDFNSEQSGQTDTQLAFEFAMQSDTAPIDVQQVAADGARLNSRFSPRINLDGKGRIDALAQFLETESLDLLSLDSNQGIILKAFSLKQSLDGVSQHYRIAQPTISSSLQLHKNKIGSQTDIKLENIHASEFKTPISVTTRLDVATDTKLRQTQLTLASQVNQQALANIELSADNLAQHLMITHDIDAHIPNSLPQEWRELAELKDVLAQFGEPQIKMSGTANLQHDSTSIQAANVDLLPSWPIDAQGKINISQQRPPSDPEGIHLAKPLMIDYSLAHQQGQQTIKLDVDAASVKTPPLLEAMPLRLTLDSQLDWPLTQAKLQGHLAIDQQQAMRYTLSMSDLPQRLAMQGQFDITADPDWSRYLAELQELNSIGEINTQWQLDGHVLHPFEQLSTQSITPELLLEQTAKLNIKARFTQSDKQRGSELHLFQPVEFNQQIDLADGLLSLASKFSIPDAQLPKLLDIKDLNGQLDVKLPASETPNQIDLSLQLTPADLNLHLAEEEADFPDKQVALGPLLTPFSLNIQASQSDEALLLDQFSLRSGSPFLSLDAFAQADAAGENGQLESQLTLQLDHRLSSDPEYAAQGRIELPLKVNLVNGEQLSLDGDMHIEQLNLKLGPTTLANLRGQLKIEEELLWDGELIEFRYLVPADPFQRVDYSLVQPYLASHSLSFDKFTDQHIEAGPGSAGISLKQNLFRLQPFDLELFGGHVAGQLYFDASPNAWQLGLLSRITEVDLRQLLPPDSPLRGDELSPVSARTAITFDIQKRLMEGRIDVTQISRAQLLQMLEVIDPDYQDPQLATVRSALRLAYPETLRIKMYSGLMDMEVKVSALPSPITVRNLPLTPLINHFGEAEFQSLETLPIE